MATGDFRWGILGAGHISGKFATALAGTPGLSLHAVAARDKARAQAFADAHGAAKAYGSYIELAEDPQVDAVYVGTTNQVHCEQAILCLERGKAVLVEKPFALNAGEGRRMVDAARRSGAFLMEAMWSRFLPAVLDFSARLAAGDIGAPRTACADLCFSRTLDPVSRLLNPALGGGALLDIGIYTLSFASWVFGPRPSEVRSFARIGPTGVDVQDQVLLRYADGAVAFAGCGFETVGLSDAVAAGPKGRLVLPGFPLPRELRLQGYGRDETFPHPVLVNGYEFEALEVAARVREGALESPEMPLAGTVATLELMDALRREWGVRYPQE